MKFIVKYFVFFYLLFIAINQVKASTPITATSSITPGGFVIDFAFPQIAKAAVFKFRGNIWLVFDNENDIDLTTLNASLGDNIIEKIPAENAVILRLADKSGLPTLEAQGNHWRLYFGSQYNTIQATILDIKPAITDSGLMEFSIATGDSDFDNNFISVIDPDVGDKLLIVPGDFIQ